jgi:hypothetical protein
VGTILRPKEVFSVFQACPLIYIRRYLFNVLVCGTLLSSVGAMADNPRYNIAFFSENGRYVLLNVHRSIERVPIFENGQYVGVMEARRNEPIWGLFDAQGAQPLEPSNELDTLMAGSAPVYLLQADFASKTALVSDDGVNIVVVDDFSEALPAAELEVLHFYHLGKLTAAYRLAELLDNVKHVGSTSSHFFWFSWDSLEFEGETLSLTTTECMPLTFSTNTGEMVATGDKASVDHPRSHVDCAGVGG